MRRAIAFAKISSFAALIRPYTTRLEIAGSIRRKKAEVKDGELVGIALPWLLAFLDHLVAVGAITKAEYGESGTHRWGEKYRGMLWRGLRVELFLTDEHSYGYQFALRTGPGEANTSLMTLLPASPIRVRDGQVLVARSWAKVGDKWRGVDEQRLHVPDEATWFKLLGMPPIAPELRQDDTYLKCIKGARCHRWGDPTGHVLVERQMALSDQMRLFEVDPVDEDRRPAPAPPTRIHPVTVSVWTPELAARYGEQVRQESIAQYEQQAAAMRRRAGGDQQSHYWAVAERLLATVVKLRGVRL